MTTDRALSISSFALPRHLGGHRAAFDEPNPPQPPPPPPSAPPAPPAPPVHHAAPPPPAPPAPRIGDTIEDVRAEAAARRIEARNEREARERAEQAVTTARAEADQRVAEANRIAQQTTQVFKDRTRDAELRAAAIGEGLVDADLLPLIDKSKITVGDDGTVSGIVEAVAEFKAKKPSYFGTPSLQPALPRRTGDPVPPPPIAPGPPAPSTVAAIPKGQEGKAAYLAARAAAVAALPRK